MVQNILVDFLQNFKIRFIRVYMLIIAVHIDGSNLIRVRNSAFDTEGITFQQTGSNQAECNACRPFDPALKRYENVFLTAFLK